MGSVWYYKLGPIVAGPFSNEEFGSRAAAGEIRADTLVRKERDGCWVPASMVEGLLTAKVAPVPRIDPPTETPPMAQSVVVESGTAAKSSRLVPALLSVVITLLLCVLVLVVLRHQPSAEPAPVKQDAVDHVALMQAEIANLQDRLKRIDALKQEPPAAANAPVEEPKAEPVPEPKAAGEEPIAGVEPKPLPPDIVKEIEAAKKAKADDDRKERARLLQRIYEQRAILVERWEIARQKLQQLQSGMSNAETDLARCETEGAALRQNAAVLERQIKDVQSQLLFEKDANRRAQLQSALTTGGTAYAQVQARYQTLDAAAAQARLTYRNLAPQAEAASVEVQNLLQQADQLRTEWLSATEAFGKLLNGDYKAAVVEFGEWIILEPDNAMPYAARGLAHHYGGQPNLAVPDFRQASRIDPKLTAMMIQEFQDFVNGVQPNQKQKQGKVPKQPGRKRK